MRNIFLSIAALGFLVLLSACKKDNFEPPSSKLTGRVVFQNQPVGLRSNGVQLELWQAGFQLFSKIPVHVDWEGNFSASLFDGDYKLTRLRGNGPWADNTDTINVQVRGTTTIDVPVDAFFVTRNETITKNGNNIDASFLLQRGNTSRALELVRLYIWPTILVDQNNQTASVQRLAATITDLTQPVTLSAAIPASLANRDFVYARVGVKAVNVAELAYSKPFKVMLK